MKISIVIARLLLVLAGFAAAMPADALPAWRPPAVAVERNPDLILDVRVVCSQTSKMTWSCQDGHICTPDAGHQSGFKCSLGPELLRQYEAEEAQRRGREAAERTRQIQADRNRQQEAVSLREQLRERLLANRRTIDVGGVTRSCANPGATWGAAEYYACHPQTTRRESGTSGTRSSGSGSTGGGYQTTTTYSSPIQPQDLARAAADTCSADRSAECQSNARTNILLNRVPEIRQACANARNMVECADRAYAGRSESENIRDRLMRRLQNARPREVEPGGPLPTKAAAPSGQSADRAMPAPTEAQAGGADPPKDDVYCLFIAHRIRSGDLAYSRDEQVPVGCRRDADVLAALEATRRTRPGFPVAGEDTDREIARLTSAAKEPDIVRHEIGRAWGDKFEDELPPGLR